MGKEKIKRLRNLFYRGANKETERSWAIEKLNDDSVLSKKRLGPPATLPKSSKGNIGIKVIVDTSEIDKALEKLKILNNEVNKYHETKKVLILQATRAITESDIEEAIRKIQIDSGLKVCIISHNLSMADMVDYNG